MKRAQSWAQQSKGPLVPKVSEGRRGYMKKANGHRTRAFKGGKPIYFRPAVYNELMVMLREAEKVDRKGRPYIYPYEFIAEMMGMI